MFPTLQSTLEPTELSCLLQCEGFPTAGINSGLKLNELSTPQVMGQGGKSLKQFSEAGSESSSPTAPAEAPPYELSCQLQSQW